MTTPTQQKILDITDIEVLRGLCLIADSMMIELYSILDEQEELIAEQGEQIERLHENAIGYRKEIADSNKDALRYELLKLIIPSMLEVAAYAGSQSFDAQAILATVDPLKLDAILDAQLEDGALEELYDEMDARAEAALDAEDSKAQFVAAFEDELAMSNAVAARL